MNEEFVSIVKDYLNKEETDYALMINGAWGSGKTFFIKNTLKSEIEKTICPDKNANKKTYKQIYVSLYGISSVEEIKERIFYAINPNYKWIEFISNKLVSATEIVPVAGGTIKNLLSHNKKERDSIRESFTEYDDKVIFFDDLERIDKKEIDIQSVLGYINFLTEHNHYKVIVVANDVVLTDDYKRFKEKTIRFSYNHRPNMAEAFDSICEKYNSEVEIKYKTFLKEQKFIILDIIRASKCVNIRTLVFITDVFQKIFEESIGRYSNEIDMDLLLPFTIISIEAKNGHSKKELKESLRLISDFSIDDFIPNQSQNMDEQSDLKEKFKKSLKDKYGDICSNHTVVFYDVLYDLIYNGYVSKDDLNSIIKKIRDDYLAREETEEVKLAKCIIDWTQILDEEFEDTIKQVNNAISSGKYNVFYLLNIYAAFIKIDALKIDGFSLTEDVTNSFKVAIDAAMNDKQYIPFFEMDTPQWNEYDESEAHRKYDEMRTYALKINIKHRNELNSIQRGRILDMIKNNDIVKFKEFISNYSNKSIFMEISPKELIETVTSSNAETKRVFLWSLSSFFLDNLVNPTKNDFDYLNEIESELNNYLSNQKTRRVSLANLLHAQKYINKVIKQYGIRLNMI